MKLKINHKLIFGQALLTLVIAVLLGGITYYLLTHYFEEIQKKNQRSRVISLSAGVSDFLEHKTTSLRQLVESSEIENYSQTRDIKELQAALKEVTSAFPVISFANSSGKEEQKMVLGSFSKELYDFSDYPLFQKGVKNPNIVFFGNPHQSAILNTSAMDFLIYKNDFADQRSGVFKGTIALSSLVQTIRSSYLSGEEFFVIVNEKGNIVIAPNNEFTATPLAQTVDTDEALIGYIATKSDFSGKFKLMGQVSYISGIVLPESEWRVLLGTPEEQHLAPLQVLEGVIIWLGLAYVVVNILFSLFLGQSITRPIIHLTLAVKSISKKEDLSERVSVISTDETGQLSEVFNQMLDKLEASKQEVDEAKRFTENIIHSMNDMLIVLNSDLTILSINRSVVELLGYDKEELLGDSFEIMYPMEHQSRRRLTIDEFLRNKFIGNTIETELRKKSGAYLPVSFSGSVMLDDKKRIQGIVCVAQDITEGKRVKEKLNEQREWLETTLNSIGDAVITTDKEGRLMFLNPVAEQLTGWPQRDAVGRKIETIFHIVNEKTRKVIDSPVQKVLREGVIVGLANHTILLSRDGREVPIDDSGAPIRSGDGEMLGVVLVFRDVSERRRNEENLLASKEKAEAAMKAKSEFLANMSHEIRTPMNGVIGMTELLLQTDLNRKQRDFLNIVSSSSDQLMNIINDILDFSKIESGMIELEENEFELRTVIEDLVFLFVPQAVKKNVEMAYFIDPNIFPFLKGDLTRIRQILSNLLNNAVKFTHTGEICLSLKQISQHNGFSQIRFTVTDTGIGISPDKIDHIFEAFSQADSSTMRKYGGTGLGLAICKKLAEFMGGKIEAESIAGLGSNFSLSLKLRTAPLQSRRYLEKNIKGLEGKSVLIVDDNATNLRMLEIQCKNWGMKPRCLTSGLDVSNLLDSSNPFDIGILDMDMPGMDGILLGRMIRQRYSVKEFPLILLSSVAEDKKPKDFYNIFSTFISRPVKQARLFDVLVEVLSDSLPAQVQTSRHSTKEARPEVQLYKDVRILVAEDNEINQLLVLNILEELGYQAEIVSNGVEVFESMKSNRYDILLMDVQMPEMDGLETTRMITKNIPAEKRPIIIAMTANALDGDKEQCLQAGMHDYISKPYTHTKIQMVLEVWVDKLRSKKQSINELN